MSQWPSTKARLVLAALLREKNQKETGVRLVQAYFQRETDVTQLLQAFFEVTYILHTEIPSDYANILRLHSVILEQAAIPLSPYDRLRSYLTRAPNDLQDAYFSTGHSDDWFANVNALWGKLNGHEQRELRAAYLKLTLAAEQAKPGVCVVNMFLAGLYLKVERDRQRALYYLRRALATAVALGGNALERVQLWFQEMEYFQPVQNDTEFQQLIQSALARRMSSISFES